MDQVHVIKRYSNRKLYDVEVAGYITQKGLIDKIRAGKTVQVVKHDTGEDITKRILSASAVQVLENKTLEEIVAIIRG